MNLLDRLRGRDEGDVFAAGLIKRLKQQGRRDVGYDRKRFALVTSDGEAYPLDSIFLEAAAYPPTPHLFDSVIEALFSPKLDMTYDAVRDQILPVVGNRMMAQFRDSTGYHPPIANQSLAEFLEIYFVVDRKLSSRSINDEELKSWGTSFDQVLSIAIANLLRKSAFQYKPMRDGFYVVEVADYYDSARILLPHVFEELELKGEPIVIVVSRNCVAVAGRDDHIALETMRRFVDDVISNEPKPIASAPIVLKDGVWVPLVLHPNDTAALRHLMISQGIMDYEAQTKWLQAASANDPDLTVAAFNVAQGGRSWTEWRRTGATLLPKADAIALVDTTLRFVIRTWDDVEKVLGPFTPEPHLYPPRYRVPAWSPEARSQLETEFESPPWIPKD